MEQAAILLVKHLARALRLRRVDAAESEPRWLGAEQYREDSGRITLLTDQVGELYGYATRNRMRPLGLVIVKAAGDYGQFINENPIKPEHRAFARELLRAHAQFWFEYLPSLERQARS